jgi:hypothetical protein
MTFPSMIKRSREKSIKVVCERLLEILASHSRFRHRASEDAGFEISRRPRHAGSSAGLQSVLNFGQGLMTNRAAKSMLRYHTMCFAIKLAIQVIS